METKSHTSGSQDQATSPSLSPIKYLREKSFQPGLRKASIDSQVDRPNFCLNLYNSQYSVMRVYIDAPASKQIRLYYTKFTPKIKKGQICIIHGYGQSTDDYLQMAEYFTKRGYVINMVDLRGFGYSGGSRVNEPTVKVLADIQTLLRNCCERDLSTFIVSHGLGSMFVNALLQENPQLPISGVINITPLMNFVNTNRSFFLQRILLKVLPTIFNNLLVHNMVNPTALSKNPLSIKSKIDSIFWQSFITLHMADQYEQVGQKMRQQAYKFTYPTLFCCGGNDLLQSLQGTKKYYNLISSQDKNMLVFKNGYHELQNDYEAEELFMKMHQWIDARRGKTKWKQVGQFSKNTVLKGYKFWVKLAMLIGFLIGALAIIRKFKFCMKKM